MALAKILYRDLLHAAKQFDRSAALRALLSTNLLQRPVIHETSTRLPHVERFNRSVLEYLNHRSFYMPSAERASLAQIIHDHFRAPLDDSDVRVRVDTAFVALKALNDKLAEAKDLGVVDPAPLKKLRYATEANATANARTAAGAPAETTDVQHAEALASGVFLLSHPLLSGLFSRSVIVLTEHSHSGARGFIVNQPTSSSLMKSFKVHPSIMRAFGSSKVRTGGPVRTEHAEVLHTNPEFGGERIRASNFHATDADSSRAHLFIGVDLETAARAVEANSAQQSELMFLNGVSTWTAGQLENELKRGTWVAVKAPLALAVNPTKDLWRDLMHALGGEYSEFSAMPAMPDDDDYVDDDDESDA